MELHLVDEKFKFSIALKMHSSNYFFCKYIHDSSIVELSFSRVDIYKLLLMIGLV